MRFDHHMLIPLIQLEFLFLFQMLASIITKQLGFVILVPFSSMYKTNVKVDKLLFEWILLMWCPYNNIL